MISTRKLPIHIYYLLPFLLRSIFTYIVSMKGNQIYVRQEDIQTIGLEHISIIDKSIAPYSTRPTRRFYQDIVNYTLQCYFDFADKSFCQGFINYYDFQPNSPPQIPSEQPLCQNQKSVSFTSVPFLITETDRVKRSEDRANNVKMESQVRGMR